MIEFHSEGLAIFSRWPILDTSYILLSRDASDRGDFHQRICLHARVATPYGNISFLTTHLSLSPKARVRSLIEIGDFAHTVDRSLQSPNSAFHYHAHYYSCLCL
jgi:endonuclease/exonuclease/phosphatase family metal-dependent hydrolase